MKILSVLKYLTVYSTTTKNIIFKIILSFFNSANYIILLNLRTYRKKNLVYLQPVFTCYTIGKSDET